MTDISIYEVLTESPGRGANPVPNLDKLLEVLMEPVGRDVRRRRSARRV